jgi:UDP-glucose 4-epimerase
LRVLLTGGAGFVGSHIADHLVQRGDEVVIVDDLSTGVAANVPSQAHLERADITDDEALARVFARARPEVVVHAAAQFSVTRSVRDPEGSARVNVQGTANVLERAREGARRFVFLSTGGAIYGETPRCATEDTPLRPISPYGEQKMRGEELVRASGIPHAILRPANVYGPRQRGDLEGGVVAAFLQRYREGKELVIYGDGSAERDYVHASDVADCALAAIDRADSGTWNVGTGVPTTIHALMEIMRRSLGEPRGGIRYEPVRSGDLRRACVDPSRAIRDGMLRARSLEVGLQALLVPA